MGITTHWATKRSLKTFLACFLITSVSSILPVLAQVSPTADGRVILITVDGMRSDVIQSFGPELLPGFHRLMQEGSSTLNARPDPQFSLTLPNHTSMFTGRYVGDLEGHNWYENTDMPSNETLHNNKGEYVASPFGDIEIKITGLRPGEKLFEELLIGDNVSATTHPLISCAEESYPNRLELEQGLLALSAAIDQQDSRAARVHLLRLVPSFTPTSKNVDHLLEDNSPRQTSGNFATDKSAAKPISRSNGLSGIQFEHGKI